MPQWAKLVQHAEPQASASCKRTHTHISLKAASQAGQVQAWQQFRCRVPTHAKRARIRYQHAASYSRPHAQAQQHAAASMQHPTSHHLLASKQEQKNPGTHSKLCKADPRCEKRNGSKPTPRAHARIAKPLTQQAPADRRHRANGGAPWFLSRQRRSSCRFHTEVVSTAPYSKIRLKHRPRPPAGRRRPDVLGPLRFTTESSGLRCVATGPTRALASTNDLHRLH